MLLLTAAFGVALIEAYLLVGLLFALPFLVRGITRLDPAVAGAPIALRLLLLPGVIAFWPLLARRWASGAHAPVERNPHRDRAGAP